MIFPKVIYNFEEFKYYIGNPNLILKDSIKGGYYNNIIWLKQKSPLTLFHELIHHFFRSIGNHSGTTRLFFDFLNEVYESIWCFIRHPDWRLNVHLIFKNSKVFWNDWLDWVFCRDVGV